MKKRRPCTIWNQTDSPRNHSPKASHVFESFPGKAKSVHDLKRRRSQRGHLKPQHKTGERRNVGILKRDAFGSLESLFDVKKPINIPELYSLSANCHTEGDFLSSSENSSAQESTNLLEAFFLHSISPETVQEPHILEFPHEANGFWYNKEKDTLESNSKLQEIESLDLYEILSDSVTMADEKQENEEKKVTVKIELPDEDEAQEETTKAEGEESEIDEPETTVKEESDADVKPELDDEEQPAGDAEVKDETDTDEIEMKPRPSAAPMIDTIVINEMQEADQRCHAIAQEIEQLRSELAELADKKELTQDEKIAMQEKHEDLMVKVAEFEEITQKIQQLLGLEDSIGCSFTKMFEMMPCPGDLGLDEEEDLDEEEWRRTKEQSKDVSDNDRFDFPQSMYPEDNLPRVIVCGPTDDKIPQIIVADSDSRGKKTHLNNLTGKLTESLTMQEKLARENAQLEGGKYKLEEALLEKDSAVENLQRKVYGLQAEMRIVVKENTELTRQLACLNQRVTGSGCAYTCPGGSPPLTTSVATPYPYEEDFCKCNCCMQSIADGSPTSPTSVSPRLTGGASKGGLCCCTGSTGTQPGEMCCRSPAAATKLSRNACLPEGEARFTTYGNTTKQLEQQLGSMENEVRNLQMELANVQRERQQLEQQRKLLKCTGPCAPCSCCPAPSPYTSQQPIYAAGPQISPQHALYAAGPQTSPPGPPMSSAPSSPLAKMNQQQGAQMCTGPCTNAPMGASTCPQQQLRDLREQYARLQEDYKNKLVEVSCLRSDSEKLKQENRDAKEEKEKIEIKLIDVQERLKLLENEKNSFSGNKEQLVEQEQALHVAKQRFREAQDEIEELRSLVQDQAIQLEDYRNKYLQAQEIVEEQRRQLDLMEMDNARMNENVTLEIGRVKNQFQEKLAELAPLPDILKQTQMKLQEAQQLRIVAERNCEDLTREIMACKEKIQTLQNQLDVLHSERRAYQDGKGDGAGTEELELKLRELRHENERMKNTLARFEEHEAQLQKRIDEKNHEVTQLSAMLEQVREDSARQVVRTKERCETVRKTMQGQIAEMERQLAQCRATARAAQKDRDEIRQKMQGQINNLVESFEQAQGRIRSLQGHVNYLKTSYTNIFSGQAEAPPGTLPGETGTGYDSCDCNY